MSIYYPLLSFVAFAGNTSNTFADSTPSFLITGGGLLSIILGCLLSFVTGGGFFSTVSGYFLIFIASDGPVSAVFSCFLSPIANNSPLSAVSSCFSSLVAYSSLLFIVIGGDSLFPMLFIDSWALFLTSSLFCVRHFFLSSSSFLYFSLFSLPISLAYNSALLTRKRLFD